MQRPGQRAIAGGHCREQIGLRRGHDARGEGRGVHAVIADRDEIGVECRHLARVGLCDCAASRSVSAAWLASGSGATGSRLSRAAPARLRSPETRRRWLPRDRARSPRADRRRGAKSVDDRHAARHAAAGPAAGRKRAGAPRPQGGAHGSLADRLTGAAGMTLEVWVYPTALGTRWRTALMKERSGGLCYGLYANNSANRPAVYVRIGGSDRYVMGVSALALNAWSHLAATYDGTLLRLYVNGTQVGSLEVSGTISVSTYPLRIGGSATLSGRYFAGNIDEVRIYNRALSQV